jgi:hypothetical protein
MQHSTSPQTPTNDTKPDESSASTSCLTDPGIDLVKPPERVRVRQEAVIEICAGIGETKPYCEFLKSGPDA